MKASLLLAFFLSRLIFLNPNPIFFDSPEYISRLSNQSFLDALTLGHLPLHFGYILIFWPIFQFGKIIHIDSSTLVIFLQIILSLLSIYCFYHIIKTITDNKELAFKSVFIASLFPLYWITNVTIMMETTYLAFFMLTLYFLAKYSKTSNGISNHQYYIVLSVISFMISALTHLAILIWLPFLLYMTYFLNKKGFYINLFSLAGGVVIFTLINGSIIALSQKIGLAEGILSLYIAKLGERAQFNFTIQSMLIFTRNFIIPLLRNYTILVVILGFISLIKMYFTNKKMFFLGFLWIAPSVIANQWWDSVLFGRHSLIAGFGLSFLTAYLLKKSKIAFLILTIYILIVSLPAIDLLRQEIPYLQETKVVKELQKDGLLIESHFARPQVDKLYKGKVGFVDEPGWKKDELPREINTLLKNNKPVFVSSQALSEPYGLYSGPYLHSLSLSYKKDFALKSIIEQFTLKEYKAINRKDNLLIYQIISDKPSPYPKIKNMKHHRRRIDYSDPLLFLYNKLKLFRAF